MRYQLRYIRVHGRDRHPVRSTTIVDAKETTQIPMVTSGDKRIPG
jgi:hypothetical protein